MTCCVSDREFFVKKDGNEFVKFPVAEGTLMSM